MHHDSVLIRNDLDDVMILELPCHGGLWTLLVIVGDEDVVDIIDFILVSDVVISNNAISIHKALCRFICCFQDCACGSKQSPDSILR